MALMWEDSSPLAVAHATSGLDCLVVTRIVDCVGRVCRFQRSSFALLPCAIDYRQLLPSESWWRTLYAAVVLAPTVGIELRRSRPRGSHAFGSLPSRKPTGVGGESKRRRSFWALGRNDQYPSLSARKTRSIALHVRKSEVLQLPSGLSLGTSRTTLPV